MKPREAKSAACALLGGVLIAGCAVGPDYKRPAAVETIPAAYSAAGGTNGWKLAEPRAETPKGEWWVVFNDPELNRLETEAAAANQQLRSAVAAFEQARATTKLTRAGYFPHIDFSPSVTRERDSANRPINGVSNGKADTYNTFLIPFTLSYEVDVWGRVRRTVEQAKSAEEAGAADLETIRLSIQAEVAGDYFGLRALDQQTSLLNSNVVVFQKSLELTRNRRAGGIATDLDVAQAETVLKTTEAQLPDIALQRARLEHALAVLTGRAASTFAIGDAQTEVSLPAIPAGMPSELLERRPDVAGGERRMAFANAGVGVANAAFYPVIKINGLAGFESVDASTLFNWDSHIWAVGPSLTLPIFQGGRNTAALKLAKAAYEQSVADYRQTVLSAFAEVEDNLAAQRLLAAQEEADLAALASARKTLDIASNRYKAGLVTYLEVATAQTAALNRESETVRLRGEQFVACVALIKSLGGGWEGLNPAETKSASR